MKSIFEKSVPGRKGVEITPSKCPSSEKLDGKYLRSAAAGLSELSELDVVRHFTALEKLNYSVDANFYPLGSCTMKYNPKILEKIAGFDGFTGFHPHIALGPEGEKTAQGSLEVIHSLGAKLCEITGMDEVSLQPMAGAHGELTGILMAAAYHKDRGEKRKHVIVPDSSHGTNPASSKMAGFEVVTVKSGASGRMDLNEFKKALNSETAAVMMTVPNTLGLFNGEIKEICALAHKAGALMYYDGANMNAILGKVKPGDAGFDIVHINVHKTFATPHGGGGPGAGPVCVKKELAPFLPSPVVGKTEEGYFFFEAPGKSIGRVTPFFGSFGVLLKAYAYILTLGSEGLTDAAEKAVLNANYVMEKLKPYYDLPYGGRCMHECVFSASRQKKKGVNALDIAKRLIDTGFHPPTVYFPLIVDEAMMIEPTETESRQTLDSFIEAMIKIAEAAEKNPEKFHSYPEKMSITRPDETLAARNPDLKYEEK